MYNPKSYLYGGRFMPGYKDDLKELKTQLYLANKKLIKSFDVKNGKQILLTTTGERVLYKQYPLSKLRSQKWDKYWTILTYDISTNVNSTRDTLRRLIKEYGFGQFQQSIYLSPLDIGEGLSEYLESQGLSESVQVFRATNVFGLKDEVIVSSIYNLDELNMLYKDLNDNYTEACESTKTFKKWKDYFIAVNYKDPYLPFELLPAEWEGDNCEKLFKGKKSKNIFKSILKK